MLLELVSYSTKRFNFGVPLEDIFPTHDIHPRLRFLFEEANNHFLMNKTHLKHILRSSSKCRMHCFKLREILIYEVHYQEHTYFPAGTYFLLIRHFLESLPISLLPIFCKDIHFEWVILSQRCEDFLKDYQRGRRDSELDESIVGHLNLLPSEHFLLLNVLITFLRRVSQKSETSVRMVPDSLMLVAQYYCSAIYTVPYGSNIKKDIVYPLLFYLLLRWRHIFKKCWKQDTTNLQIYDYRDSSFHDVQSRILSYVKPELLTTRYFLNNNKIYLKDIGSQTEKQYFIDKGVQSSECREFVNVSRNVVSPCKPKLTELTNSDPFQCNDIYLKNTESQTDKRDEKDKDESQSLEYYEIANGSKYVVSKMLGGQSYSFGSQKIFSRDIETQVDELNDKSDKSSEHFDISCVTRKKLSSNRLEPIASSTVLVQDESYIDDNPEYTFLTAHEEQGNSIFFDDDNRKTCTGKTGSELNFFSLPSCSEQESWYQIMEDTGRTVKRIDEYIYDDYETFQQEDFNQIGLDHGIVAEKSESKQSIFERVSKIGWTYTPPKKSSMDSLALGKDENFHEQSYYKFMEVDDHLTDKSKFDDKKSNSNNSESDVLKNDQKSSSDSGYLKFFKLKRFKISLNFLRVFTKSDSRPRLIYENKSNVKYKRINNIKAYTL